MVMVVTKMEAGDEYSTLLICRDRVCVCRLCVYVSVRVSE